MAPDPMKKYRAKMWLEVDYGPRDPRWKKLVAFAKLKGFRGVKQVKRRRSED